ncbi:hypothetical protein Bca4012_019243 [Brassica carinata]
MGESRSAVLIAVEEMRTEASQPLGKQSWKKRRSAAAAVVGVLSYGRNRKVIIEALHDKDCVLGNILAAHYLFSSDHSRAKSYLEAATSNLGQFSAAKAFRWYDSDPHFR